MLFYQIASYVAVWKKKKIDIKKRTCMMPGKRINTSMIAYSLLMRKKEDKLVYKFLESTQK